MGDLQQGADQYAVERQKLAQVQQERTLKDQIEAALPQAFAAASAAGVPENKLALLRIRGPLKPAAVFEELTTLTNALKAPKHGATPDYNPRVWTAPDGRKYEVKPSGEIGKLLTAEEEKQLTIGAPQVWAAPDGRKYELKADGTLGKLLTAADAPEQGHQFQSLSRAQVELSPDPTIGAYARQMGEHDVLRIDTETNQVTIDRAPTEVEPEQELPDGPRYEARPLDINETMPAGAVRKVWDRNEQKVVYLNQYNVPVTEAPPTKPQQLLKTAPIPGTDKMLVTYGDQTYQIPKSPAEAVVPTTEELDSLALALTTYAPTEQGFSDAVRGSNLPLVDQRTMLTNRLSGYTAPETKDATPQTQYTSILITEASNLGLPNTVRFRVKDPSGEVYFADAARQRVALPVPEVKDPAWTYKPVLDRPDLPAGAQFATSPQGQVSIVDSNYKPLPDAEPTVETEYSDVAFPGAQGPMPEGAITMRFHNETRLVHYFDQYGSRITSAPKTKPAQGPLFLTGKEFRIAFPGLAKNRKVTDSAVFQMTYDPATGKPVNAVIPDWLREKPAEKQPTYMTRGDALVGTKTEQAFAARMGDKDFLVKGPKGKYTVEPFGLDMEKQFKNEAVLRREYNGVSKDYTGAVAAYLAVLKGAEEGTSTGDLTLIQAFQKMLDPTSVVRETEFANAQNTQGYFSKISILVDKVAKGHMLSNTARARFVESARNYMSQVRAAFQPQMEYYQTTAKYYGFRKFTIRDPFKGVVGLSDERAKIDFSGLELAITESTTVTGTSGTGSTVYRATVNDNVSEAASEKDF
jgi:hypothetical protein